MRSRLLGLTLLALATGATLNAQGRQAAPAPAAATNDVAVTVTYTGKGPVDPGHSILLFLFDNPNISGASQPLGPPQIATKNGATVTFKNLGAQPVYVVAIYNEKGDYDGQSGPPPAGTPVATYGENAKTKTPPKPVTPGPKTAIKFSFSDATRFGGHE